MSNRPTTLDSSGDIDLSSATLAREPSNSKTPQNILNTSHHEHSNHINFDMGQAAAAIARGAQEHRQAITEQIQIAGTVSRAAIHAGGEIVEYVQTPQGQEVAKAVARSVGHAAQSWLSDLARHPEKIIGMGLSFGKSMCDGLGLTDLAVGVANLGFAGGRLVTGDLTGAKSALHESGRAAKGVITLVGEVTGITDCIRAVDCFRKHDYAGAAFYGAFGVTQLAAVIATAGVLNSLAAGTKRAAREGFETIAKETGEKVVAEVSQKITSTELKEVGAQIAKGAAKTVEQIAEQKGAQAVTETVVKKIVSDEAARETTALLNKHGVAGIVEKFTTEALELISKSSKKELTNHLIEQGMEEGLAKNAASAMKLALGKSGQMGLFDKGIKDIFINEITGQVKEDLMKRGLAEGFEQAWKVEIRNLVAKGISEEMLVRAGREGLEEGVELGVRRVVREGVEEAFRKFRNRRGGVSASSIDNQQMSDEYSVSLPTASNLKLDEMSFSTASRQRAKAMSGHIRTAMHTKMDENGAIMADGEVVIDKGVT